MSKQMNSRRVLVSNSPSAIIAALSSTRSKRVQATRHSTIESTIEKLGRTNGRGDSSTTQQIPSHGVSMNAAHSESQPTNVGMPSDATQEMMMQVDTPPAQADLPKTKVRGRTKGLNADKEHESAAKKLKITVVPEIGRPTGNFSSMFSTEIGIIIRNHAPLDVEYWKDVKAQEKEKLVDRLAIKFDFDLSQYEVKEFVRITFSKAFYNFRNVLKDHFLSFKTKEEALQNRHPSVRKEEYWTYLCNHFSSERFKIRSAKNAINRSKLSYHHKAGSKSFMAHAAKIGEQLGAIERFESLHKSKEKGWDVGSKEKWDEMMLIQTETTLEDGTRTMTDDDIVKQVLGEKSGYIKGSGYGPKPILGKSSGRSVLEEKNKALEDQVKALEEKTKTFEEFMARFNGESKPFIE